MRDDQVGVDQVVRRSPPQSGSRLDRLPNPARAHPLAAYFVTTFALSWTYWGLVLGILGLRSLWWFLPGAFGPPVAAVIVTGLLEGRPGVRAFLRRFVVWRVGVRWYLLALVALPLLVALAGLPLGHASAQLGGPVAAVAGSYLASVAFLAILGGGEEEPGWRGFALPRLQERFGPLVGSVLLGVLWGLWHLPLFVFVPDYNSAGRGPAGIALTFLAFAMAGTVGQSLLLTWLFNHTRGSVLLAVLAHASLNAGWLFVAPSRPASITVFLALAVAGAAVAIATRGRLGHPPSR
jgi:membrane protease YdiL (CAAX protease family)